MPRSLGRLVPVALSVAAGGFLLLFLATALLRLSHPFALEWQEGSVLQQVERVRQGLPLYVRPSPDYVPLIYPPLFFWVGAAATALAGTGLAPLRAVSLLAALVACAALFALARRETGRARYGVVAAGLFAATYPLSGAWLDVARVDSLALALLLASAAALRSGRGLGSAAAAGALGALAILTKQSGAPFVAALAAAALPFEARRAAVFAASAAAALAAPLLWLDHASGGWLRFYVLEVPASHPLEPALLAGFWTGDLVGPLAGVLLLAGFALLGLRGSAARDRAFWLATTAAMLGTAWGARLHAGGYLNTLLPAHAWLALLATLGLHRALEPPAGPAASGAETSRSPRAPWRTALALLFAAQLLLLLYDPRPLVPRAADRAAGEALVERLAAIDGEVWVLAHGELAQRAGKGFGAHRMAVQDLLRGELSGTARSRARALEREIERALRERRYAAIVLDDERSLGGLDSAYTLEEVLFDETDPRFFPVSGLRTRPTFLYRVRGPAAGAAPPGPARGGADRAEVDRLRALGYLDFAAEPADPTRSGVVLHDAQRSHPGYNLYSDRDQASATLMDAQGSPLRTWSDPGARYWSNVELLPDGDLLVVGADAVPGTGGRVVQGYLLRLGWDGTPRFEERIPAHHDAEQTPAGDLLTLVVRYRLVPELHPEIEVQDNQLVRLGPDGVPRALRSLYDVLRSGGFEFEPVAPKDEGRRPKIDLLHGNSVEWMRHPGLWGRSPLYGPDHVLVCLRHQDRIAIVDWEQGRLVWSWGRGVLSGPHDASLLASGNILLFDNGLVRGWSRVLEIDPRRGEIVWRYQAPDLRDFFSASRGSSQRLPNGNTLIANSDSGHAFEVTRGGEIVWEWFNPRTGPGGHRATIVRMKRYESEAIEALQRAAPGPYNGPLHGRPG